MYCEILILALRKPMIMSTVKLESNIHNIVDRIQNEEVLQTIYDFLKVKETNKSGGLWESLTKEQKEEVYLSFEESEDESNLNDRESFFERTK